MREIKYSILFIIYISRSMNNKKSDARKTQIYTQNLVASGVAKKFVPLGMSASTFNMNRIAEDTPQTIIHIDGSGPTGDKGD